MTLQEAYDKLGIEFIKSKKTPHLCRKELNEVLSAQKPSSDKTGLGYVVSSGPSSSTASGSRTVFVPQSEKGNKRMKSKIDLANSKSFVRPYVCHHCGVFGHIRLNCFKLYPHKQLSKRS